MHLAAMSSWSISWDLPTTLAFCAYIGWQEAFLPPEDAAPLTSPEREWRAWWDALLPNTLADQANHILR